MNVKCIEISYIKIAKYSGWQLILVYFHEWNNSRIINLLNMIKSSPSQKTFYLSQNNIFLIKPFQCDDQEKYQVTVGIYEKNLFKSYDAFIFKHYLMLSDMVTYYNQFF
ncbi:hypothetical protein pb186bvf_014886 [Paramecium bursaria]